MRQLSGAERLTFDGLSVAPLARRRQSEQFFGESIASWCLDQAEAQYGHLEKLLACSGVS